MAGQLEDQRIAANIYASLSSYVITASLGVIAAQAALATFVLDKRDHLTWFYTWMVAGLIASVVSIVLGGKGIAAIASKGFSGSWTLNPNGDYFNRQAAFCLIGMALLLFSLFSGKPKPENSDATEEMRHLTTTVGQLQTQIDDLKARCAAMSDEMKSISNNAPHIRPAPMSEKRR
jgi:hypothetical protein